MFYNIQPKTALVANIGATVNKKLNHRAFSEFGHMVIKFLLSKKRKTATNILMKRNLFSTEVYRIQIYKNTFLKKISIRKN